MPIFGDNTAGGDTFPCSGDRALLSKFTAPANGVVTQINVRFDASSTAGTNFKGLIYAADGAGGIPGTRLGIGSAVSVPAGGGDLASTGLSVSITGGVDYWLGGVVDNFQAVFQEDTVGGLSRMEGTTYASPNATWTESGTGTGRLNAYATYTDSGASETTLKGPILGRESVQSSDFYVGADGAITGTVTVTPSDGGAGGTFSPTSVAISSGTPTATFRYTPPAGAATRTISTTNDGGLSNPASIAFVVQAANAPKNPNNIQKSRNYRQLLRLGSTSEAAIAARADIFGTTSSGRAIAATITEAGDTLSATVSNPLQAAAAITEAADTLTATAVALLAIAATISEAGDTLSATITTSSTATIDASISEAGDTLTAAAQALLVAAATITEAPDTAAATLGVLAQVAASITEAGDTLSAALVAPLSIAATIAEADDTLSAAMVVPLAVAAAITEAGDTLSASLVAPLSLSATITEAGDTLAAAAQALLELSATIAEAGDTLSATAVVGTVATIDASIAEADDTLAAAAVAPLAVSVSISEAADTLSAAAVALLAVSATITEAPDTLSAELSAFGDNFVEATIQEEGDTLVAGIRNGDAQPAQGGSTGRGWRDHYRKARKTPEKPAPAPLAARIAAADIQEEDDTVVALLEVVPESLPPVVSDLEPEAVQRRDEPGAEILAFPTVDRAPRPVVVDLDPQVAMTAEDEEAIAILLALVA